MSGSALGRLRSSMARPDRVVTNGGEVVTAPYPEGDLRVATFRDPAGNVIGVWQQAPREPNA